MRLPGAGYQVAAGPQARDRIPCAAAGLMQQRRLAQRPEDRLQGLIPIADPGVITDGEPTGLAGGLDRGGAGRHWSRQLGPSASGEAAWGRLC